MNRLEFVQNEMKELKEFRSGACLNSAELCTILGVKRMRGQSVLVRIVRKSKEPAVEGMTCRSEYNTKCLDSYQLCTHAEIRAISAFISERQRFSAKGVLLCNYTPCLSCVHVIINAPIQAVVYDKVWEYGSDNIKYDSDNIRLAIKIMKQHLQCFSMKELMENPKLVESWR